MGGESLQTGFHEPGRVVEHQIDLAMPHTELDSVNTYKVVLYEELKRG